MTFADYIEQPQSKKIAIVEVDAPLKDLIWLNYQDGIWFTTLTPGSQELVDDHGNTAYWDGRNDQYYNVQSLNVSGELYGEAASLAACMSTEKSWFYDTDTTKMYIHFDDWNIPEFYQIVSPGAAIGFTNETAETSYYEDIYYEPLIQSIPNITKKRDALFYGLIQFQGGSITFNNTNGYFDSFADLDLYNQPVRIKLSFEGLPFSEAETVYTARVDKFSQPNFSTFNMKLLDIRKALSRELPVNEFNSTDHPNMDSKYWGTPIPIAYGDIIKAPAYKTSSGNWTFCDTEFNAVTTGIIVSEVANGVESQILHGGTETDGTFTATDTDKNLYVRFTVSLKNSLDVISSILEDYEGTSFNSLTYDTTEWAAEKNSAYDMSLWIGKGSTKKSIDVIEDVCVLNQGIFDVLADGRYTFRTSDENRPPTHEIKEDELLQDPFIDRPSDEYLSSVVIGYSKDLEAKEYEEYNNTDFESEVYGRYGKYRSKIFNTALENETDAIALSNTIMNRSKFIFPKVSLRTKVQNIQARIMDNTLYECKRQNGNVVIARSLYENLGIVMDITAFEVSIEMRQIKETSDTYATYDGGDSTTDYDYIDGGDSTTDYDIIDGGGSI